MQRGLRFSRVLTFLSVLLLSALSLPAQNAIDFSLRDLEGNTIRLSDFLGKHVILIDFWATWCVPCVKELPHFQRFHTEYRDKGLKIFAISVDGPQSASKVKPFMSRYKYDFSVLLDTESKVIALYNPRVILPYSLLIDKQGRIRYVHQGYSPGDEITMEARILELLQEEQKEEAGCVSLSVNESFLSRVFADDDYVEDIREGRRTQIINWLDLNLTVGDFLVGARVDLDLDFSPWKAELDLGKRFVAWNKGNLSLRAGDFYYSIGRGLTLSVLKTFEKEGLEYILDTTIDGGRASFSYRQFHAAAYGGWIDQERSDLKDTLIGGTLGWKIKDYADLSVHVMDFSFDRGPEFGRDYVTLESLALDIPDINDMVRLYGEFALVQKDPLFSTELAYGHGLYLESGIFVGNLTMLFQFKDFFDLDHKYNRPPMLESEQLPILANQFVTSARDVTGAAGRLDYSFPDKRLMLYARSTFLSDRGDDAPRDVVHVFGGVEKKFKKTGWFDALVGYRSEDTESLVHYYTHGDTLHFQLNLSYPITSRFSLEADTQYKDFTGRHFDYFESRSFLSLHYSPYWILTFMYDKTTDPQVLALKDKEDWFALQLEIKVLSAHVIRISYGATKGGVKCSGGVCRFFPPFEGFRMEANLRF